MIRYSFDREFGLWAAWHNGFIVATAPTLPECRAKARERLAPWMPTVYRP